MNKNSNIPEYSLPDYIRGSKLDDNMISLIESKIIEDINFRNLYLEMSKTMKYLDSTEFISPPDNYFNTLLPKINDKIDKNSSSKLSVLEYFREIRYFWKYLIPVLPVILLIIIYKVNFKNVVNESETLNSLKQNNNASIIVPNQDSSKIDTENIVKNDFENPTAKIVEDSLKITKIKKKEQSTVNINESNATESYEETDIFSNEEDEFNTENEFINLNERSQLEILNNLKNEKL